ncbi:hypothetical protein TWF506_000346 [Arthrobotrys conoides]|uniref:Uncharacterized protein n=1 Tax=Arthrobotrys conoides TaxID=74498 RepID=A0AAN8P823_9PEZI
MSDAIGVQADITNIPCALTALSSIAPLLRAFSADGVNPLAVVQLETIGSRFPMSGPLAERTMDALTKRGSAFTLWRAQVSVGWMRGDTAWALSQTAGGQASALLTVCLVELCCRNMTGHVLFKLSKAILPADRCLSSMHQLSDLAEIVSNKMQSVGFGQHLADLVTRIRMTYFHSGFVAHCPDMSSLLDRIEVDSLVDILNKAQTALQDEKTTLRIEGFPGIAGLAALFTGLCRDDVLLLVENEIISQGPRRSIIISVVHGKGILEVSQENALDLSGQVSSSTVHLRKDDFLAQPGRMSGFDRLTMRREGCLGAMVKNLFAHRVTPLHNEKEPQVVLSLGNLIGAIILTFKASDCGLGSDFPEDGLRSLLGTSEGAEQHTRDQLGLLFGTDLDLSCMDVVSAYHKLRAAVAELLPDTYCTCSECPDSLHWDDLHTKKSHCYVRSIWGGLQPIIGYAILLTFVEIRCDSVRIIQKPGIKAGYFFCDRLVKKIRQSTANEQCIPADADKYSVSDLHVDLCEMFGSKPANAGDGFTSIATSNGATAIFPSTLMNATFHDTKMVSYILMDGQYHNNREYYKAIIEDAKTPPRLKRQNSLYTKGKVSLSNDGVHSNLTLTAREYHDAFILRTTVQVATRTIDLSFYALQMAYMSTTVAPSCIVACHRRNSSPPPPYDHDSIAATGIDAPLANGERLSMALVHGNGAAQFLAGVHGIRSLFQGSSCLDCAVNKAQLENYQLLIQS